MGPRMGWIWGNEQISGAAAGAGLAVIAASVGLACLRGLTIILLYFLFCAVKVRRMKIDGRAERDTTQEREGTWISPPPTFFPFPLPVMMMMMTSVLERGGEATRGTTSNGNKVRTEKSSHLSCAILPSDCSCCCLGGRGKRRCETCLPPSDMCCKSHLMFEAATLCVGKEWARVLLPSLPALPTLFFPFFFLFLLFRRT